MQKNADDFLNCLPVLIKHEVNFIIVGGICAVLHGAPVTTFDLDIVHSRSPENLHSYQLTKHLAGSLEGPSDLGHNKDYLQGFGE